MADTWEEYEEQADAIRAAGLSPKEELTALQGLVEPEETFEELMERHEHE